MSERRYVTPLSLRINGRELFLLFSDGTSVRLLFGGFGWSLLILSLKIKRIKSFWLLCLQVSTILSRTFHFHLYNTFCYEPVSFSLTVFLKTGILSFEYAHWLLLTNLSLDVNLRWKMSSSFSNCTTIWIVARFIFFTRLSISNPKAYPNPSEPKHNMLGYASVCSLSLLLLCLPQGLLRDVLGLKDSQRSLFEELVHLRLSSDALTNCHSGCRLESSPAVSW